MFIAYRILKQEERLRIYQPADVNAKLVDEDMQRVGRDHCIAPFKLIDQRGDTVTNATFDGKIYVADFFFTTCPSICPKMTANMGAVVAHYKDDPRIMFLSHTVMPRVDSVPVLAAYGQEHGADPDRWKLVTGPKEHIYELARRSYFAVTTEGDGGEADFIHTENFILVDNKGRIRGFYDGTSKQEMDRLKKDVGLLMKEVFP
ncbi:MAG: SCO family protein [Flavobacteriales bacterium]|nr:SCO family protein [Flavobacteriales bacterium]